MKEYAIYPFKNINISQNWNEGNHVYHWKYSKNYSDKPWDEAGIDTGREYFIPQNDYIVEEILGVDSIVTNTVRLRSLNKLYLPYGVEDYLYITLTHMNEDNLKSVKVGQILKKGSKILLEGTDGNATGNHFHITANIGKYYGFLKNSNGAWCYTYEKSLLPEEAFYVDKSFNNVVNTRGSNFVDIPKLEIIGVPVIRNKEYNQLEIKVDNLRCRSNPSLNSDVLGYIKPGIYNYYDVFYNNNYTWYDISVGYVAYNSEWIILYPKNDKKNNFISNIKNFFLNIFLFFKSKKKR